MKKIPALLFLLAAVRLFSMDWPSDSGTMTGNFGWNELGRPRLGVSFEAEGTINAAEAGDILYHRREGDTASRLPSPLGSWIAVDHGDGIISVYSRFADAPGRVIPEQTAKGGGLGEAGVSGWSSQEGFYFQLFDRKERRWINPAMIISPPADNRPPEILAVSLRDAQGRLINPSETVNLGQGRYTVLVEAADTLRRTNSPPLAPHRIICSLNGTEAGTLNFETYSARDGKLMVYRNGLVPVKQIYAPVPGYEIAELWFTRGQNNLEIIARDIAGNAYTVLFRLTVE